MNFDIDHRAIAVKLFNRCWEILDELPVEGPREGPIVANAQTDELERAAYASLYHWSQIGDEKNIAIGEWMIAHMYMVLGQFAEAERFALRVIELCEGVGLGDYYLAYGYLEMARIRRASSASISSSPDFGNPALDSEMDEGAGGWRYWLNKAKAVEIADPQDREQFEGDLAKDGWGP